MAHIDATATHDGRGNVTIEGYAATYDGAGGVILTPTGQSAAETAINAQVRTITAKVELLDGSTLLDTFGHDDRLQGFTIERVGVSQFFGFGICQKLNVKLIDTNRALTVTAGHVLDIEMEAGGEAVRPFPAFTVTEVNRDENTNGLSITAYDAISGAAGITVADISLTAPYTVRDVAEACAAALGLSGVSIVGVGASETCFTTSYANGANFEGTETLREVLDDIAEATQTIYFVTASGLLCFKRLAKDGDAAFTVDCGKYFKLSSKTNRRLSAICSATELGDNVTATLDVSGTTQYVRDNAFWALRDDVAALVDAAMAAVGGLTVNQFEMEWRGNFLAELGDKLALETKDGGTAYTYLLDDTITYNGAYAQRSAWAYTDSEETESNPTSLGDVLKQTYARVDKANRQIDLVASEAAGNTEAISALQVNTSSISASVQATREYTESALEGISGDVADLTSKVEATITPEQVQLSIQAALDDGVAKVATETGFTFDDRGLTVTKSDSDLSTTITEDGMTVSLNSEDVLTANNQGVNAKNLHATTYLIIGENSRFEDYEKNGEARTGCFWIGPVSI